MENCVDDSPGDACQWHELWAEDNFYKLGATLGPSNDPRDGADCIFSELMMQNLEGQMMVQRVMVLSEGLGQAGENGLTGALWWSARGTAKSCS